MQEWDWSQDLQNTKEEYELQEHTVWWDQENKSILLHDKN